MKKKGRPQEARCPRCKHQFFTTSKLGLITCNDCGLKFKREENLVKPRDQRELKT